jgi:hypothetical protein
VSVFRPAVRVRAPDGRDWEVYAYKLRVERAAVEGPRLTRLVRAARLTLVSAGRSLRTDEWTIEAICFVPGESYRWRTTREFKGQVLARVEGGLARGDPPTRLPNASFLGWRRPR